MSTDIDSTAGGSAQQTQYGYRLPDGRIVWAWPQSDGTWTPWQPDFGIDAIDILPETTIEQVAQHLPVGAAVLTREVTTTYGPTTEHPVAPGKGRA